MTTFSAIWQAAWYELDQPIKVGMTDEFWFIDANGQRIFCTGISSQEKVEKKDAKILSIKHKYLGDISEINTEGLTYKFVLTSGREIIVEAEESPGKIVNDFPEFEKDNFTFSVILETT